MTRKVTTIMTARTCDHFQVGILRRQPKPDQASNWIQPGQMINQPGTPGSPSGGPGPTVGPPVPARLRPVTAAGPGDWLRGALRLGPGSLIWTPDSAVSASPVELATATALPNQGGGRSRKQAMTVDLQTPQGQFQLEMDPVLFEMSQELVAEEAARRGGPAADPGVG
jgi:hypothetical protein